MENEPDKLTAVFLVIAAGFIAADPADRAGLRRAGQADTR